MLDRIVLMLNINGKPVCYIDEQEWGLSVDHILSHNDSHRIFCPVQVDRRLLPKIKEWMNPIGHLKTRGDKGELLPDPIKYRDRGTLLPLDELGQHLGISNLEITVQHPVDTVPILNGLMLSENHFKPSQQFSPEGKILDLNTVSSGSYTIGVAQNYATWALFCNDNAATLTGGLTGTQKTAVTETAVSDFGSKNLAGYALTITSDTNPLGQQGLGWLISFNQTADSFRFNPITTAGTINMSNLNWKRIVQCSGGGAELYLYTTPVAGTVFNINDCIFDRNLLGNAGAGFFFSQSSNWTINMFNCVFANDKLGIYGAIGNYVLNSSSIFENITILNCNTGIYGNSSSCIKRNIAALNCNTCFQSATVGTFTKCASSDTSGSEAGLRSLSVAKQFQSLDITSANFLKLKQGSDLITTGAATSITANTYGVRGNVRPTP